jgi:coenzyme A diphosphatase NUDT7
MPLAAFLRISPRERKTLSPSPGLAGTAGYHRAYHSYRDVHWGQGKVRMHRFLTGREEDGVKPVYGLTALVVGLCQITR